MPPEGDVQAMRLFSVFHQKHIAELQKIIIAYQKARWPVFGYLFCRARVLELDGHLGKSLFIVDSLNAHQRVFQLEFAYRAFSKFSSAMTRAGIQESHHCIVFQQVIDGLAPQVKDIDVNLSRIGQIRTALSERPYLKSKLGLDSDNIEDWTTLSTSTAAVKLRDAFSYATHYRRLREAFRSIPKFDYVGDKVKLESLQAQRLANKLDKEVIDFSDNNRNLALSIRDIIRKRQRFPRESFEALRKAFPCMIASIRDFAEYVPLEKDLFDIVVIDEASQVSIAQAFPAFIRAKKLVVLGDRKQFSNVKTATASTATNNVYANAIMNDFGRENALDDNTVNRLRLFNIKTSVLEFVERIANAQTMLKKHFRSYPELISFSSQNFYSGQLQAVKIRGEPIEDVIRFTAVDHDGRIETRKNTNAIEYDAILKELRRLAEFDPAPSVGIITPFSEQQSLFVQKIASDPDSELFQDRLRLKIMTFDSCQGDERDVIIYSMVATSEVDKLSYIFPKSLSEADEVDHQLRQQRLNVGFSRAKERVHFFHSQPFEAFRGAIGQAIAHYRHQLTIGHKRPGADTTDPKSPMEARVRNWLFQTHFVQKLGELVEIDPQFELGRYLRQIDPTYKHPAYRVDFLIRVHSPQGTINIVLEYDGFKEHFTNLDKVDATNYAEYYKPEDVERQKVLEGYGYHFLRINRFNLGKDPARSLDERLLKLAGDALKEVEPHVVVDEAKEVAAGILNGEKKLCETCGVVRDVSDFKDSSTKSGMSRKCRYCKEQDKKGTKRRRNRRRW